MKGLSVFFKTLTCIFGSICAFQTAAQAQSDLEKTDPKRAAAAVILDQPVNDPRFQNRKHERVSSIAASSDGKEIYIAWYTGAGDEGPGNYVTLAVSLDFGKTWLNDQLIVYPEKLTTRFFDPALWRDQHGQIWLFYTVSMDSAYWDLKGGVNAMPISWSGSKIIYEKPRLISYGVMMNKPVYVPEKNLALFPVSVWNLGREDLAVDAGYPPDGTFIKAFLEDRKNKKRISQLASYSFIPVLPDSMRIFDEHQIVQISGANFLGLVRASDGIYFSTSSDYAKTWSKLAPFTAIGPTTSSRCHISRLRSGNIILVLNNSKTRNNMTVFLSNDNGKTWPCKLLLDDRRDISYPDVSQTRDGTIHITYDHDRSGAKDILYCRFKEEDVIHGNANNIFRSRVNALHAQ